MHNRVQSKTIKNGQLNLPVFEEKRVISVENNHSNFNDTAFVINKTLPIHRWVPWVAGFSSSFVKDALNKYNRGGLIMDPFAGVGTTLVDSLLEGFNSVGFEINPYAALACRVKTCFNMINLTELSKEVLSFKEFYNQKLNSEYIPKSGIPKGFKTRHEFFSDRILRKVLIVQDFILSIEDKLTQDLFRLVFASNMVKFSNYSYEPSLSTRTSAGKSNIQDFPVGEFIEEKLFEISEDIKSVLKKNSKMVSHAKIINDSFFKYEQYLEPESIDLIITSPPYLNNYHYNRNTRPQLYWLNFTNSPKDFQELEEENVGKYWQTVRDIENVELVFSLPNADLIEKLKILRSLNTHKGIYGGNGWANYAATYFNDCFKFAQGIKFSLQKGGRALVVIGNSILQGVMIETDQYFGKIAESIGLKLIDIEIPRSERVGNSIINSVVRVEKAKKAHKLYEAVVHLEKV